MTKFEQIGKQAQNLIDAHGTPAAIFIATTSRNGAKLLRERVQDLGQHKRTKVKLLVACPEDGEKNFHFHFLLWHPAGVYDKVREIMRALEKDDVAKVLIDKEYRAFRHDPKQIEYKIKLGDGKWHTIEKAEKLAGFAELQQAYVKVKVCYAMKGILEKTQQVVINAS